MDSNDLRNLERISHKMLCLYLFRYYEASHILPSKRLMNTSSYIELRIKFYESIIKDINIILEGGIPKNEHRYFNTYG